MTTISIQEFRSRLDAYLEEAGRGGEVVITRDDKAWLVLQSVSEPLDVESIQRVRSAEFWELIRARRAEPTLGWEEVRGQLDLNG